MLPLENKAYKIFFERLNAVLLLWVEHCRQTRIEKLLCKNNVY